LNPVVRSDDVRVQNRRRVLSAIRRVGPSSRTDIAQETGLSAATVSAITASFLEENILLSPSDITNGSSGRGRPTISLSINPEAALICSINLRVNFLSVELVDYSGQTVWEQTLELENHWLSAEQLRMTLLSGIEKTMSDANIRSAQLQRIAVGLQGLVNVEGTKILWSPICQERNMPVKTWLETHFGVATHIANDCHMIAQALSRRDPSKYSENFAAILLAQGVGMGLFLRQNVINGTRSSGTEFGHMTFMPDGALCRCGKRGCIEAYAGDYAIARAANGFENDAEPSQFKDTIDLEDINQRARAGDERALQAIEQAGIAIGTGLAGLFALVDPFPVVLVGNGAVAFDLMEPHIRNVLKGAMIARHPENIDIDYIVDERSLVCEGSAITALMMHDDIIADRKSVTKVSA